MYALNKDNDRKNPPKQLMKGGTIDFNWESVRNMNYKDRECHLGYTVKLGHLDKGGKWKKSDWWTKDNEEKEFSQEVSNEIMLAKAEDERRMNIALGLVDVEEEFVLPKQSGGEARELTKKIQLEATQEETGDYYEKVGGIGFDRYNLILLLN